MTKKSLAQQVIDEAAKGPPPEPTSILVRRNGLSSGSTLLNCALTGNPHFAFLKGFYYFMVGDSASGKTIQAMTIYAEAAANRQFKDHRFIYDNTEDGMLMDSDGLFGMAMTDRLEPPSRDKAGNPRYSRTLEEFYYHLEDLGKAGRPFIYILDSIDALDTEQDDKKFDELKKAHDKARRREEGESTKGEEKDEKVAGSFGMARAKLNSSSLRRARRLVGESGSILIILSQTRQSTYGKTRSGGEALRFYATAEFWTSIVETIKRTVRGKPRKIGIRAKFAIKKNRHTGKLYEVETDIYPSLGIDDLGGCVDYMLEEGFWTKQKESIDAPEFKLVASREKLISYIEQNNLEGELRAIVGKAWEELDAACSLKRKRRYQ
jgi:RecA/RadA recombinase